MRIKKISNGLTVRSQSGENGKWEEVGFVENPETDYKEDAKSHIDEIKSAVADSLAEDAKSQIDNL